MRFLGYTLADPSTPIPPPSPDLYATMGEFVAEATQAGVLLATGGLASPDEATRVKYTGGGVPVLRGPFAGAEGLLRGRALVGGRAQAEAGEWAQGVLTIVGAGEATVADGT